MDRRLVRRELLQDRAGPESQGAGARDAEGFSRRRVDRQQPAHSSGPAQRGRPQHEDELARLSLCAISLREFTGQGGRSRGSAGLVKHFGSLNPQAGTGGTTGESTKRPIPAVSVVAQAVRRSAASTT